MAKSDPKKTERLASLSNQGQVWKFTTEHQKFIKPELLFDPPIEITVKMLRGLRMVDETIVVYGDIKKK